MPRARSRSREVRDLVVRAAQLEAEDRLQVLALEQHLVAEPLRQPRRRVERRLARHVVHAARQDVVEELGELQAVASGRPARSQVGITPMARDRLRERRPMRSEFAPNDAGRTCWMAAGPRQRLRVHHARDRPAQWRAQIDEASPLRIDQRIGRPKLRKRWTSPLPTIGLPWDRAQRSAGGD